MLQGFGPAVPADPKDESDVVGRMNSQASQSNNCGCEGSSTRVPKSSGVVTRPWPKYACQIRFTMTRAVVGLAGSTIHLARPRRLRGAPAGKGLRKEGTPGCTTSA